MNGLLKRKGDMKMSKSKGGCSVLNKFESVYKEDRYRFKSLPGITDTWTPEKLVSLFVMLQQSPRKTQNEIAAILRVDRSCVSRKSNQVDWDFFSQKLENLCALSTEDIIVEEAEEQKNKTLIKLEDRERKKQIDRAALMSRILEKIEETATALPPVTLPRIKRERNKEQGTPEAAVLLLSDLHVGEKFSKEETGGVNEYNLQIFLSRAARLKAAVVDICNLHQKMYEIPELHVFALGDMVQGHNLGGEWGPAYTEIDVTQQSQICADAISDMLKEWSRYFKKVEFTGVVGNHGRAGITKNSDKVSANWDNTVYAITQARLLNIPNVKVEYPLSWWSQKNVNGTEFLLVHGEHIKASLNNLRNEEQRLQSVITTSTKKHFNVMCIGHFHNHMELETSRGRIIVNGSFVGGDIYTLQQLKVHSRSTQTMFGVHPDNQITWKYNLDLDKE